MREHRREHDQRREHEHAGRERGDRRDARRRTRSASWPRGWSRPASPGTRRRRGSPSPARPTPGSRRSGSGGARRTPSRRPLSARSRSTAARTRRRDRRVVILDDSPRRAAGAPAARAGTWPTRATPCAPRSKRVRDDQPRRRRARARRVPRGEEPHARISASDPAPTATVAQCTSPSDCSHVASSRHAFVALRRGAGQLRQLADDDVDRGAGEEPRDHGLGEELRDPAHPERGEQQEQHSGHERDRGDELRGCRPPRPVASTAPPATAASDELGPVEMCREVQKSA